MVDENRKEDIKIYPMIEINLNNYHYKEIDKVMSIYALLDVDSEYQNHVKIKNFQVEVYLPKLREKEYTNLSKEEKRLLGMFETSWERASRLVEGDEELMDYNEILKNASKKPEIMEAYDKEAAAVEAGYGEGYKFGQSEGYKAGQSEGYKAGQNEGYKAGQNEGYKAGQNEGYKAGQSEGYKAGQSEGYKAGQIDGAKENQVLVIKNMLSKGLNNLLIAEYLNLGVNEVDNIIASFKNIED